jgi:hypothetical protein
MVKEVKRNYYLNLFSSVAEITLNGSKNAIFKWNIRDLQLGSQAEIALVQIIHTNAANNTGYTFRILAMKLIMENPKDYGFDIDHMELYEPYKTECIIVTESIPNIAKWAISKGFNFKIVTKLNPWLKGNKLTIKKKQYKLLLPSPSENLKPYKAYI